jgi:hypothetical protein
VRAGTINLTTGQILGSIRLNYPFEFISGSAAPNNSGVTANDNQGHNYTWFTSGSATIQQGQTSVTVNATAATN